MVLGFFRKGAKPKHRVTVGVLSSYDQKRVREDWEKINQLIRVGKPSAMKEAIITADKLLGYVLTQISFGESMGERLKNAKKAFPKQIYQGLWEAHKVRNALVHDFDYDLTQVVAQDALGKFKEGFRSIGVLL
jgi:hypothetical protein